MLGTLSLFPTLLSWSLLAPVLIRITLGAVFLVWAYRGIRASAGSAPDKLISALEGIAGVLLIIGLWTQGAALFAILDLLVRLGGKIRDRRFLTDGINYYLILLVLAVCVLITGPGLFSADLPL